MARKRPRSSPADFKGKILELVRAGRRIEELAVEFELSAQTIRNWQNQSEIDSGKRGNGLTSDERAELSRLRKQVRQLTIEREILSKAAVDSTSQRNRAPLSKGRSWESIEDGRGYL